LLISTLPCRPVFLAKKELVYIPFLGWLIWLAGFIFVDRGKQSKTVASLQRAARKIREGQSIAAFPEGTRTRTGSILPFKRGVFALAKEAEVLVVPMAIIGGFRVLPPNNWRVAPGDYTIRVSSPLRPQDFPHAQALMKAAEAAVHQLMKEQ
jgi:1-acyl-sn-glycerol-3-phosphate acyltransferase